MCSPDGEREHLARVLSNRYAPNHESRLSSMHPSRVIRIALLIALPCALAPSAVHGGDIEFNRDVRPILTKNCLSCHGRDEASREAGLRLDDEESARAELDSGMRAIVPGSVEESELVYRITSDDEYLRMPPPESHKELTPEEIATLQAWIAGGAEYQRHWSFIPPQSPEPPVTSDDSWARTSIDRFIRNKLSANGLAPAPEADRRTLIRRLTLDLTGLPPTPAEVAAFVEDGSEDAYEKLVDRLLESPHFGERMAVAWLDAARYADTHGYHIDSHRTMWHWRDWVIDAYNENLPFDDFTEQQIAGDLLPDAGPEQLVATGFNRNHGINFEGGAIPEEYHVEYVVDRVNTTGTVWMGLSLGCARCHDHKYDPISQEEYFKFFAFFNTIDEEGIDGERGNAEPNMPMPTDEQRQRRQELADRIAELESRLEPLDEKVDALQTEWEASAADAPGDGAFAADSGWYTLPPVIEETAQLVLETDRLDVDQPVDVKSPVTLNGKELEWVHMPDLIDGCDKGYIFERAATYMWRRIELTEPREVVISAGCTDAFKLWHNGELLLEQAGERPIPERQTEAVVQLPAGENILLAKVINISWECDFNFALRGIDRPLPKPLAGILAKPAEDRSEEEADKLRKFFRACVVEQEDYHSLQAELLEQRRSLQELDAEIPTVMVMREMTAPRMTYRLDRGQYDSPKEEVRPDIPAALPGLEAASNPNRLDLARWLTRSDNPLTARVAVNRLWQLLFGAGIVVTSEDLGLQGSWPSHPELLDWLAVEFVRSGWDVKHMVRLMVTSSTYRQHSGATPGKLRADPENALLSRGPRFRLQAEFIRDLALSTSGLLDPRIGGPSVKLYQPGGLWKELAHQKDNSKFTEQVFYQSQGRDLYRRGMYAFWKRSVPPPNLTTLDAPNREICTVRRERTNTPLQALVMLNDPTFVEAARFLAQRALLEAPSNDEERIRFMFELATSRQPSEKEVALLAGEVARQAKLFEADPSAAEALLGVGDAPRNEALDAVEHAAWTNLASLILNLDETITKG